ncbi:MAG: J domain-containing protein [Eubacterium sp.]|nr:J domain-containing protein [Eubacterium sp.]
MTYKWFQKEELHTMSELRAYYRKLLKQHHPDNGGDVDTMQEINAEYDALFASLRHKEDKGEQTYTYKENARFKAILNEITGYNIDVEIIGSWIWVFQCYAYKDRLKSLGFKYAAKKKAWIWHAGEYSRYRKKDMTLNSIREKYGSQMVKKKSVQCLLK